ncbi:hypothetical protein HK100_004957 [Physocladia obscura]|uniref:Uncharacterized protein n=1 Tax=Physocladia obscura TaxID=109957 RepID=A0AAD5T8P7_9FUNG|nr:hypothetical protein HK100_004957 [Physocladia obscura]
MTVASILREDALVRKAKVEEDRTLSEVELTLKDTSEYRNWKDEMKIKVDEERKSELEKLRLKVQLLHEESFLARQDKLQENKEVVKEAKEEKEILKTLTEIARKEQEIENKKKIEDVHEIMEGIAKAKEKLAVDRHKKAADINTENQMLKEKAQREAEEELARKVDLIQQIRLLEKSNPPVGAIIKAVDLTESSNLGLLGEMSIIELQERLAHIKSRETERTKEKRQEIIQHKTHRLNQILQKLEEIDHERNERKLKRIETQQQISAINNSSFRGSSMLSLLCVNSSSSGGDSVVLLPNADPEIKELQDKLLAKKAKRQSMKNEFSNQKLSGTAASILACANQTVHEHKLKMEFEEESKSKQRDGVPALKQRQQQHQEQQQLLQYEKLPKSNEQIDDYDLHSMKLRNLLENQKATLIHGFTKNEDTLNFFSAVPFSVESKVVTFAHNA